MPLLLMPNEKDTGGILMKDKLGTIITVIILIAIGYAGVACERYRWAHPELTETQRSIHFFEALMWK
jgi:hypothetical protein